MGAGLGRMACLQQEGENTSNRGKVGAHELILFVINCNIIHYWHFYVIIFWRIFTDIYNGGNHNNDYQISVGLFQESGSRSHYEGSRIPPFCKQGRARSGRIAEK